MEIYKNYLTSKTFWAAVLIAVIEVLQALQAVPYLTPDQLHAVSGVLAVAIAVNRAFKNQKFNK